MAWAKGPGPCPAPEAQGSVRVAQRLSPTSLVPPPRPRPRPPSESALVQFLAPDPPMFSQTPPLVQSPPRPGYTGILPSRHLFSPSPSTCQRHLCQATGPACPVLTLTSGFASPHQLKPSLPNTCHSTEGLPQCSEGAACCTCHPYSEWPKPSPHTRQELPQSRTGSSSPAAGLLCGTHSTLLPTWGLRVHVCTIGRFQGCSTLRAHET